MTRMRTAAACGLAASALLVLATAYAQEGGDAVKSKEPATANQALRDRLIDLRARVDILEEQRDVKKASLSELQVGLARLSFAREDEERSKDVARLEPVVSKWRAEFAGIARELARTRLDLEEAERRYQEIRR